MVSQRAGIPSAAAIFVLSLLVGSRRVILGFGFGAGLCFGAGGGALLATNLPLTVAWLPTLSVVWICHVWLPRLHGPGELKASLVTSGVPEYPPRSSTSWPSIRSEMLATPLSASATKKLTDCCGRIV